MRKGEYIIKTNRKFLRKYPGIGIKSKKVLTKEESMVKTEVYNSTIEPMKIYAQSCIAEF